MDLTKPRPDYRPVIGILLLFAVVYLLPLGIRPFANPDEVRYAEIAREMIATGDWITPHLNGARYFEKPILGYWINAASFEIFSQNEFALRLPSALAVGLTALLLYWLTVTFTNRRTGLLSSGVYLSSFAVFGIGTFAVLDSYLTLFLTAALAIFYQAYNCTGGQRRKFLLQCAWGAACGCAFLTKGFLGLVLPAIVIGPFLILERRWRALFTETWIPMLAAFLVALPWSLMIHFREPDFWRYFIVVEHLQRFMGDGLIVQHENPWWYFLAGLPVVFFPWSVWPWTAYARIRNLESTPRSFVRFLACWILMPLFFFSISAGKLITYILPCLAPLAILLATVLTARNSKEDTSTSRWPGVLITLLFGAGFLLLLVTQLTPLADPVYRTDERFASMFMLAALGCGGLAGLAAIRARSINRQLTLIGLSIVPFFIAITIALPAKILDDKTPGQFIESIGPIESDAILVADSSLFNALSWTLKRSDIYVVGQSEVEYGFAYPEEQHRELDMTGLLQLVDTFHERREIVIFAKDVREEQFADALPAGGTRSQQGEIVLWTFGRADNFDE